MCLSLTPLSPLASVVQAAWAAGLDFKEKSRFSRPHETGTLTLLRTIIGISIISHRCWFAWNECGLQIFSIRWFETTIHAWRGWGRASGNMKYFYLGLQLKLNPDWKLKNTACWFWSSLALSLSSLQQQCDSFLPNETTVVRNARGRVVKRKGYHSHHSHECNICRQRMHALCPLPVTTLHTRTDRQTRKVSLAGPNHCFLYLLRPLLLLDECASLLQQVPEMLENAPRLFRWHDKTLPCLTCLTRTLALTHNERSVSGIMLCSNVNMYI